ASSDFQTVPVRPGGWTRRRTAAPSGGDRPSAADETAPVDLEPVGEGLRRQRAADVVALRLVARPAGERGERLRGLDSLGDDAVAQPLAHADDGPDQVLVLRALHHGADEGLVDLE